MTGVLKSDVGLVGLGAESIDAFAVLDRAGLTVSGAMIFPGANGFALLLSDQPMTSRPPTK